MVPYSERRHRLRGDELEPVKEAIHRDLLRRLETRDDLLTTACVFRAWYRMEVYCKNKPSYPPHDTWEEIQAFIGFGTVSREEDKRIRVPKSSKKNTTLDNFREYLNSPTECARAFKISSQ